MSIKWNSDVIKSKYVTQKIKEIPLVINKAANNNNKIDLVFLLRTGESLNIKIDSFNKSLKPLLSRHRIVKSLKSLSWLCSKTEHHPNVRSSEHIGISKLTGKRVECKPSAVLDHLR